MGGVFLNTAGSPNGPAIVEVRQRDAPVNGFSGRDSTKAASQTSSNIVSPSSAHERWDDVPAAVSTSPAPTQATVPAHGRFAGLPSHAAKANSATRALSPTQPGRGR